MRTPTCVCFANSNRPRTPDQLRPVRGLLAYPQGSDVHARDAALNDVAACRSPRADGIAGRWPAFLRGECLVDEGLHKLGHLGRRDVLRPVADRKESPAAGWDHCHEHGYVRGPLCGSCNTREGTGIPHYYLRLEGAALQHLLECRGCLEQPVSNQHFLTASNTLDVFNTVTDRGRRGRPAFRELHGSSGVQPRSSLGANVHQVGGLYPIAQFAFTASWLMQPRIASLIRSCRACPVGMAVSHGRLAGVARCDGYQRISRADHAQHGYPAVRRCSRPGQVTAR
ncbi:endonuclease domain-containing protein [Streptomyces coeruleorubidus]|uniref:endonuclease domain-containing protein n=1 Tax=Streptomyces coeruleorubidus TaxID=116188 RepID=UPI0033F85037